MTKKYTISVPIIGYMTTTIEVDENEFINAQEVLEAILDDEIDVSLDVSMLDSWYPVMNIENIDFYNYDMPTEVEVS